MPEKTVCAGVAGMASAPPVRALPEAAAANECSGDEEEADNE